MMLASSIVSLTDTRISERLSMLSTLRLPHGAVARDACVVSDPFEKIDEGGSTL
ncbi:hypothetical protein [Bradyrhizobium diversitatis]|uniref:Uncharacterized protein n=1 Tax=Bradyrhizobium diversitatis TaxID=2755406 RepID=A0ABS0P7Z4_9BRAD|nr:hypothetical protein [Bradyrhizobium diversitatis]MBH5389420.1 hypothetical protein [Bradyrhizobium diversitatis]